MYIGSWLILWFEARLSFASNLSMLAIKCQLPLCKAVNLYMLMAVITRLWQAANAVQ